MSLLDSAIGTLKSALNSVSATAQSWSQEWQNSVDSLKNKAQQFTAMFSDLQNKKSIVDKNPALKAQYDSLMNKGSTIRSAVQSVTNALDYGFALTSGTPFQSITKQMAGMGSLGILPLVPIAVITGAIAAITAWLADASVMQQKINLIEKTGATGSQVTDILNSGGKGGLISSGHFFQSAGVLMLLGVGVLMFWPTIQKALNK